MLTKVAAIRFLSGEAGVPRLRNLSDLLVDTKAIFIGKMGRTSEERLLYVASNLPNPLASDPFHGNGFSVSHDSRAWLVDAIRETHPAPPDAGADGRDKDSNLPHQSRPWMRVSRY